MRLKTFKAEQQNTNEHGKTEMKLNQRGKKRIDKHIHTLILVPSFFTVYCRCVCVCLSELASSPLPSLSLCMYVCMFILQCIGQCKVMKCGTTSLHFLLFIYIYIYIFKYSPFLFSSVQFISIFKVLAISGTHSVSTSIHVSTSASNPKPDANKRAEERATLHHLLCCYLNPGTGSK